MPPLAPLKKNLRRHIRAKSEPVMIVAAYVFGSCLRVDFRENSDPDLRKKRIMSLSARKLTASTY